MDELERRLRNRDTEDEQKIAARLKTAAEEMKHIDLYQFEIINDSIDRAVTEICQLLNNEKRKAHA